MLAPFTGGTCGKSKLYNADQGFFRLLSWVPTPTIWSVFALSKNARFWRNPWLKKLNEVFWPNFFGVQKPAGVGDLVERIGSKAKQQNLSDSIFLCDRKHDPKKGPHFRSLFFWKGNGRTPAMLPWGFTTMKHHHLVGILLEHVPTIRSKAKQMNIIEKKLNKHTHHLKALEIFMFFLFFIVSFDWTVQEHCFFKDGLENVCWIYL